MWDTMINGMVRDGKNIQEIIEVAPEDNEIYEDREANECRIYSEAPAYGGENNTIRRRNMVLFEENVDSEENKKDGWSNPTLSNNRELNQEVMYYQRLMNALDEAESGSEEELQLEVELDMSFRRIAGYYSNYEYRWFEKMGHLFEEPILFYDFFYDLLRECLLKFDPGKESSNSYANDYRKAKKGVYFNQYFFGALSKRKITNLKKTMNTANHPSIKCHVCGDDVTRITEFHLRHQYDEARIRKDFKLVPKKIRGDRVFEKCPICGEKEVPTSHVKEHSYAEQLTVREYIDRYPHVPLSGSVRSLQEPLTVSDDGDELTYEDVYHGTEADKNSDVEMALFSSHIDNVLKDDPFTAEVLKLKMMDYKDKEIAALVGDTCTLELEYSATKNITKKSEIFDYITSHMPAHDFFMKHDKKFHILSRTREDDVEVFEFSSCAPSQVNLAIKKLRNNKLKIKELFGDFGVPNV